MLLPQLEERVALALLAVEAEEPTQATLQTLLLVGLVALVLLEEEGLLLLLLLVLVLQPLVVLVGLDFMALELRVHLLRETLGLLQGVAELEY